MLQKGPLEINKGRERRLFQLRASDYTLTQAHIAKTNNCALASLSCVLGTQLLIFSLD